MMQRLMAVLVGAGLLASGCGGPTRQVKRLDTATVTDLSGQWNDTDARLTSEALIKECFEGGWLSEFLQAHGRKPAIRVRGIVNKTDEHIDAQIFIKNIERAMVNSAKTRVLAQEGAEIESMEGEQVRATSGRQGDHSPVAVGNEAGADYVVAVRLASVLDEIEGAKAKLYQINFELINSTSGEKAWIGQHQIKKVVTQNKSSW